ncbi:hypothetical protein F3Y22_tig00116996pilonHSYRG00220 [Hibiscus syriacus]|uniref:Uncharacterized protein n=1 Tax=Hibiscus syriacus TaxID=106335 RepID=A0A6A2WN61_HIBSY|nr:hypothetical protein F3Y22_tig00116996pilonHSYRG00220 [Hibiscus syriacus]
MMQSTMTLDVQGKNFDHTMKLALKIHTEVLNVSETVCTCFLWKAEEIVGGEVGGEEGEVRGEEEERRSEEELGREERGLGIMESELGIERKEGIERIEAGIEERGLPDELKSATAIQSKKEWPNQDGPGPVIAKA